MEKAIQQYIDFYNNRWEPFKRTPYEPLTYKNIKLVHGLQLEITKLSEIRQNRKWWEYPGFGALTGDRFKNKNTLRVSVPIALKSRESNNFTVSATTQLSLFLKQSNKGQLSNLELGLEQQMELKDFKCSAWKPQVCDDVRNEL